MKLNNDAPMIIGIRLALVVSVVRLEWFDDQCLATRLALMIGQEWLLKPVDGWPLQP